MPSEPALDIVNSVFAGQKDLSDYVDSRMKELAVDSIEDLKKDIGKAMFAPTPDEPEEEESSTEEPETAVATAEPEEPTDETDNRTAQ